jgi:hypothetical protein
VTEITIKSKPVRAASAAIRRLASIVS